MVLRFANAFLTNKFLIKQGRVKLPKSLSFVGSLFYKMVEYASLGAIVNNSSNFLLFDSFSFNNLPYLGICERASTNDKLI